MTFTSIEFVLFFLAILALRACVRTGNGGKWLLLVASICFYLSWSVPCILLILFTSIFDYSIGQKLGQTADETNRKRLLLVSLLVNLGLLGFFKYTNFFLENISVGLSVLGWHVGRIHYNIVLPPAISFYTFASMSYVIDVYYERLSPCKSTRDYTLFIIFFPKLLSGPIMRATEFLPQLEQRVRARAEDVEIGLARFLVGAVKKLVIADQVAGNVNLIFSTPARYDGFTLLQGLLGYAVQIYCDFSGYCDMAIGCGRILGFRIPENFQMAFSATSITEFWRRWHITLSSWLRDYIFLPLEMATRRNRNATARASFNVMVTFLLCGLWHGASWNFVIWGGIMGAALATHIAWVAWNPFALLRESRGFRIVWSSFSHLLTLGVVLLSLVFFRTQSLSDAGSYVNLMLFWSHHGTRLISPYILAGVGAVLLTHLLIGKDRNWVEEISQTSAPVRIGAYTSLTVTLVLLGATDSVPFLYFQF